MAALIRLKKAHAAGDAVSGSRAAERARVGGEATPMQIRSFEDVPRDRG